jgi:hypothetical protein
MRNSRFDLFSFRRVVFWLALLCLIGNQIAVAMHFIALINEHNEAVALSKEDSAMGALAKITLALSGDMEEWAPDYMKLFFNPTFPFAHIDSWNVYNHILGWAGIIFFVLWVILKFSLKVDSEGGDVKSVWDRISSVIGPLFTPSFREVIMIHPESGEKKKIEPVRGFFLYLKHIKFWFAPMFAIRQYPYGVLGVALLVVFFISISMVGEKTFFPMMICFLYVTLGVLVTKNMHKFLLAYYKELGWVVESEKVL